MRIYIAGPLGDHNPDHVIAANVARADEAAKALVLAGHTPFCPHKMLWGWQKDPRLQGSAWFAIDLSFIDRWAEGLLRLPGDSPGADREVARAQELGLPVYYNIEAIGRKSGGDDGGA